jgi:hypothetical protein
MGREELPLGRTALLRGVEGQANWFNQCRHQELRLRSETGLGQIWSQQCNNSTFDDRIRTEGAALGLATETIHARCAHAVVLATDAAAYRYRGRRALRQWRK